MKKILLYSLMFLLPLGIFAQRTVDQLLTKTSPLTQSFKTINPEVYKFQGDVKVPDNILAVGTRIDTLAGSYFDYGMSTPFIYDPDSKLTILVTSKWYSNPAGDANGNPFLGEIAVRFSSDFGISWSTKRQLMYTAGDVPVWPSIAVTNPNKSSNPNDLNIQTYSYIAYWQPNGVSGPSYYFHGGLFLKSYPGGDFDTINVQTTDENINQHWFQNQMLADYRNNTNNFYFYGELFPTDNQNFCYGVAIRSESNEHYYLPNQWQPSKFVQSETPNTLFIMDMYMDKDPSGNLYALVDDIFLPMIDNNDTIRQPGVSKSTDQGETWTEFQSDTMPSSLLDDFNAANGAYTNAFTLGYIEEGFAVTGTDEFSFVFSVILQNTQTDYVTALVEASRKGGTWQPLKLVSPLAGIFPLLIHSSSQTNLDTMSRNRLGFETQLSKTADNQYLICKWIDYNGDSAIFNPAISLAGGGTVSQLYKSDVFMSYRKVTDPSWSTPVNITNDQENQKLTKIPPVVNSIKEVPLLTTLSAPALATSYRFNYSSNALQFCYDGSQFINSRKIDLTSLGVEYQPAPVSDFYLGDVYPNPTSGIANIVFSSDKPDFATLELFNELGQKVKVLYNDNIYTGRYVHTLNTSDLPVGTYFYTLTVGTQSLTKILNVIR